MGYRWRTGVAGSFDTYRSIVNLGSGPKLLGAEFTLTDPKHRAFDRIDVRAYSWGDDPYATLHLRANKAQALRFQRRLPRHRLLQLPSLLSPIRCWRGASCSISNPSISRRRLGSFQLDLLPGHWFIPYLAYDRDSGSGTGATTFVSDGNRVRRTEPASRPTNLYRGGVRFELRRLHATLEQGGTTFKDDQSLYQAAA